MNSSKDEVMAVNETETGKPIPGRFVTKGDSPLHTGVVIPVEEWAESLG